MTKGPFRYDQVGSLLRTNTLKEAKKNLENESISIEEIISKYVLPIEKQIATERTLRKVKNKVQSLNILSRGIRNE